MWLTEKERMAESTFEDLVLLAPKGEIMLRNAVEITKGRAYTSIRRINGRREISVTANIRPPSQAENVLKDMKKDILPDLLDKYPGLSYSFKGHQADIRESITALLKGLGMALLCIFALLAIPFKSYLQPFIIMFCIPFGIIGAIVGIIGQLSDLIESLYKRDAGVKDSANILPGHGGFLDRFDSPLLVGPTVYLFFVISGLIK